MYTSIKKFLMRCQSSISDSAGLNSKQSTCIKIEKKLVNLFGIAIA